MAVGNPSSKFQVFLNVPYGPSHERRLLALTSALISIGCRPRLTFEIPEHGQGRLARILELIGFCTLSIHDLSSVGYPARFNMPFELGLACAIKHLKGNHRFMVLERVEHRFDRHLSDLKAIDPKIHNGTVVGAINAVLDSWEKPDGNPSSAEVLSLYRRLRRILPLLKSRHHADGLFRPRIYGHLVALGTAQARAMGF